MGPVRHKHLDALHDPVDLFRVGKDGRQNTTGTDIRKNFRQAVLSGFKPAMDTKYFFHSDCLTSLASNI